ncbi:MAG: hypothetical protein JNM17_16065 [Archangium sp.]|nr:hypothetical protein [Archangium sp.]
MARTLCEENGEIFVYDASGQYEVTLAGRELRVVGPEVWVSQANGLSHWTDLGTELRFDGTAMVDLAPLPRGETRAGRALRATTSGGLVEVTWNGVSLESRPVEVLGLMNQDEAVFLAGDEVIRVGPGQLCSAPRLGMDARCEALFALAIDAERVWVESIVESGDALALVRNRSAPFASAGFVRMPRIRNSQAPWATLTDFVTSSLPAWNLGYGVTEFPTFTENGGWVREWRHDGLLVAASDDWLISRMGPYTLRFHRMR